MSNFIIATLKEWNFKNFKKLKKLYPKFNFFLIKNEQDLTLQSIEKIKPKFIFFPHWSFYIPSEIYENYECVIFHESDVPFGRGGSPLQNLILRGIKETKISALKADKKLDAGEVYLKENLDISKGSAEKLYKKASKIIFFKMIPHFFKNPPKPTPQEGEAVVFKRRKIEDSDLQTLQNSSLEKLYDFIRMLDAPTYPKAFLNFDNFKITFKKVKRKKHKLKGGFSIREK